MKPHLLLFILLFPLSAAAQTADYSKHVKSIDSTIETLYAVISGEKGEARDWELFKYLFIPDARLIPSGKNAEGKSYHYVWSPAEYVEMAGSRLEANGFFEKEISRETDRFGNVVQLFSTYESYNSEADEKPFARGINSIQLLYDRDRWWVVSIFWQAETGEYPIPSEYLD